MASSTSTGTTDLRHGSTTTPAPPPPTPSNHALSMSLPTDADDGLSRLLHQLLVTPTLSCPPRSRAPRKPAQQQRALSPNPTPPLISLLKDQADLFLSAASNYGYFHLTDHGVPSHLFAPALVESQPLINSNHVSLTNRASLGFSHDDVDDESGEEDLYLVLDVSSGGLGSSAALREYVECLKRVGVDVVEKMFSTECPFHGREPRCLMWISSPSSTTTEIKEEEEEEVRAGWKKNKNYPYVVCVQYEMKPCWVPGDSGDWVPVAPRADSLLVTVGDVAQVWSNGRFKKVRGIPESSPRDSCNSSECISVSLLITLPMDSIVFPLVPRAPKYHDGCNSADVEEGDGDHKKRFCAFPFEEHAWRVYHERFSFKDPLLRYRI